MGAVATVVVTLARKLPPDIAAAKAYLLLLIAMVAVIVAIERVFR